MTVSNQTNKIQYTGDGVTTVFSFPFKIFEEGDLKVYLVDSSNVFTLQTITTHYTVSISSGEGGSVTMVTAPTSSYELLIIRELDLTQPTDIPRESNIPEKSLEDAYDRSVMISQQLDEKTDRTVRFSETSTLDTEITDDLTSAANKTIVINTAGTGLELGPTTSEISSAQTYATNAATSASNAATSESNAATSESNAAASAASAAGLWREVTYVTNADSPVTVSASSTGIIYSTDTSSGAVVFNLPGISTLTLTDAWAVGFKKTTSDANTITINRDGTDTIEGDSAYVLSYRDETVTLVPDADGSPDEWTVMNQRVDAKQDPGTIYLLRASELPLVGELDLTGNNASFDGGGTITADSLTLSTTAADLINGHKVIKYNPDADGSDDYFGFTRTIPRGMRGRFLGFSFEYKNDSTTLDDDFRFCVKQKDGTDAGAIEYFNLEAHNDANGTALNYVCSSDIAGDCTEVEVGWQNTSSTTTVELYVDNLAISGSPYPKSKYAVKTLPSDISVTTSDISDLKFNNLSVGRYYRIGGMAYLVADAAGGIGTLDLVNNSVIVASAHMDVNGATGVTKNTFYFNAVFKAAATTLQANYTDGAASTIGGNGTRSETHIQLEEIPDTWETTDWD